MQFGRWAVLLSFVAAACEDEPLRIIPDPTISAQLVSPARLAAGVQFEVLLTATTSGTVTSATAHAAGVTAPLTFNGTQWRGMLDLSAAPDGPALLTGQITDDRGRTARDTVTIRVARATGGINITSIAQTLPLTDMVSGAQRYTYHGLEGGLYPGGANTPPAQYNTNGIAAGASVVKLDAAGRPSATGRIGAVTIGMSNHKMEMCGVNPPQPMDATYPGSCRTGSFMRRHISGAGVTTNPDLVIVNAAEVGYVIDVWDNAGDAAWSEARSEIILRGLTEAQIQVAFIKNVLIHQGTSLPSPAAAAHAERIGLEAIIDIARARYPNLKQVFLWPRTYGGYSNGVSTQSPEPYAFESGYAVKWVIERFINGTKSYGGVWVGWGPYMWARGTTPRQDGLTWRLSDFETDRIHPSADGISKVGGMVHDHFMASAYSPWYRRQ